VGAAGQKESAGIPRLKRGTEPRAPVRFPQNGSRHFFAVAILSTFYQFGFWSLLPQNNKPHIFYYIDLSMHYSLYILREIKKNEHNIGESQLSILFVPEALCASGTPG
jgi:hypothetical protein